MLSVAVACCILFAGWRCYRYYYAIGVPISVSPKENIAKLERPVNKSEKATIVMTQDSILGVALNFYTLDGLRAELTTQEPPVICSLDGLPAEIAHHLHTGAVERIVLLPFFFSPTIHTSIRAFHTTGSQKFGKSVDVLLPLQRNQEQNEIEYETFNIKKYLIFISHI